MIGDPPVYVIELNVTLIIDSVVVGSLRTGVPIPGSVCI